MTSSDCIYELIGETLIFMLLWSNRSCCHNLVIPVPKWLRLWVRSPRLVSSWLEPNVFLCVVVQGRIQGGGGATGPNSWIRGGGAKCGLPHPFQNRTQWHKKPYRYITAKSQFWLFWPLPLKIAWSGPVVVDCLLSLLQYWCFVLYSKAIFIHHS